MKLYSHPAQPNAVRVLMFIDEKGIEVPVVDLDMLAGEHKSPDYLKKNPLGQVPALELDDGTTISESLVICRYLDEAYGEPFLFGNSEKERGVVALWERRVELGLFIPSIEYGHHTLPQMSEYFDQFPDWAESLLSGIEGSLARVNEQLSQNKFLAGNSFSIADITGFLGVQYAEMIVGLKLPAASPGAEWVDRVSRRKGASSFHTVKALTEVFLDESRQTDSND
jgi:glutathione S-transferase